MKNEIIKIANLYYRLPDGRELLHNISLDIMRDSLTVISGKNGSGKTVLMKHLNGLLSPSEGDILIDGISVQKDSWNARSKIGFVFQNSDTQIVAQTVRDDIAFGPENIGLKKNEIENLVSIAAEELDITGILDQSPHRLSGGEKKRAAIAGITVMNPEIIIFDEPFTGLDFQGVRMLISNILKLRQNGTTIIIITHDLEKILAHADNLVIMSEGKIAANGSPAELLVTAAENGIRIPKDRRLEDMSWLYE